MLQVIPWLQAVERRVSRKEMTLTADSWESILLTQTLVLYPFGFIPLM